MVPADCPPWQRAGLQAGRLPQPPANGWRQAAFSDPGIEGLLKIGPELARVGRQCGGLGVTLARGEPEAGSPRVQGRGSATELINGPGGPRHNNANGPLARALMASA